MTEPIGGSPLRALEDLGGIYVAICWRDRCSRQVDPEDDLGLCPPCRDELRATG